MRFKGKRELLKKKSMHCVNKKISNFRSYLSLRDWVSAGVSLHNSGATTYTVKLSTNHPVQSRLKVRLGYL